MAAAILPARILAAGAMPPPNIVLIVADDLGYGDLACYGHPTNRTPNLDRLAREGIRFTDFHANGPKCSPTRAALLTGRYQQRAGVEDVFAGKTQAQGGNYESGLPHAEVTLAELLKQRGYATGAFGKWHLGHTPAFGPHLQGFEEYFGNLSGNSDYFAHVDQFGRPDLWERDQPVQVAGYHTDLISRRAAAFVESHRDRPFFLYLPFLAIHAPYQGPGDKALRQPGGKADGRQREGRPDKRVAVSEMLERLDWGVGQVIERVRTLGLAENTLVFFLSDNGGVLEAATNTPCRGGKGDLWEGGHRVPAIAWWPGRIRAGTECRETVISMDLLPTLTTLAGTVADPRRPLDGVDLAPVLFESQPLAERTVFWRYIGQKAARRGPWKWVVPKDGTPALYNLAEDVAETRDLSRAKPAIAAELAAAFDAWEAQVTRGVTWVTDTTR